MTQPDPYWQTSKSNMKERNAVMFNNELQADVHFIVGSGSNKQRIPVHKYILLTGSPVFHAMLCSRPTDEKKEIAIPDVEPQAFLMLLKWVGNISANSDKKRKHGLLIQTRNNSSEAVLLCGW